MIIFSRRALFGVLPAISVAMAIAPSLADDPRLALRGYDPVSYFTEGRPEKGLAEFSATFDDAIYHFKSAHHRTLFAANPEKYAPQFGGYCTIDLSRGIRTEPDPEAWAISDGKLYVFGRTRGPGVFAQESSSILPKAMENWAALRKTR